MYDDGAVYDNGMPKKWSESTVKYATIGVGFASTSMKRPDRDDVLAALDLPATYSDDMTLTDEQIYQLLDANYQTAVSDAQDPQGQGRNLDDLCCNVRNALVSMSFNLGHYV